MHFEEWLPAKLAVSLASLEGKAFGHYKENHSTLQVLVQLLCSTQHAYTSVMVFFVMTK